VNLGYTTHPERVGAPLPAEMAVIEEPDPEMVRREIARCKVELMYAIARHRQAWAKMRMHAGKVEAEHVSKGLPRAFLDSDPEWGIIVGDVRWWREEMNAQATTLQALQCIQPRLDPDTRHRTARQIVFGWNPRHRPTRAEYQAALVWKDTAGADIGIVNLRMIDQLIAAYEAI
jgi:hypothetical protein